MNTTLSEACTEAYASAPTNEILLDTFEIIMGGSNETVYLVNNNEDLNITLEDGTTHLFEGAGVGFKLPSSGENGRQDLVLSLDNTDLRIFEFMVKASLTKISTIVKYRPYLYPDLSKPQMDPPIMLTLKGGVLKNGVFTAKATFADMLNKKFPGNTYNRSRFKNLGG